jgi:WD40-like Beta Propeller Repeat
MKSLIRIATLVAFWSAVLLPSQEPAPGFTRILGLAPEEGVFAYARISPDGQNLVYASEVNNPAGPGRLRAVTIVDLASRKTLFTERGIDAYWSPDGQRIIYSGPTSVSIRNFATGEITRDVAPPGLGDYYSWGRRDGKDLILTITSHYYYLNGDKAAVPAATVAPCPGIGIGDRPLLSKDGTRITTFVNGTIVVRGLTDCENIMDTQIQGAKADFSWDGRYIAFHVLRKGGAGYDIDIVDLERNTVRVLTAGLTGQSFFPSWTQDGRLCFRYDGDGYRGFMMADHVLSVPEQPLPTMNGHVPLQRAWLDVFPQTPLPAHRLNLVLVWGTWGAHSPDALIDLERAGDFFRQHGMDVGVSMATDPGSAETDVKRMLVDNRINLPRIALAPERLWLTEENNQNPTTLLFRDGVLAGRRMGAQSDTQLRQWIADAGL